MTCQALLIFTQYVNSIYFYSCNYKDASYPHFNLVSLRSVEGRHYHADGRCFRIRLISFTSFEIWAKYT